MKFLSDILAKAGLTVDGVVTLNNTATGQTPDANDNSTKLATTAWVRGFVTPYTLPIASGTTLGGIKIGSGLSIDGTGIVSVAASGVGAIRALQQITATAGQTVFTVSGGYTPGLIDVFLNGVLLTPTAIDSTNGNSFTLADGAINGDLLDVFVYNPIYNGFISSTDQVPEGLINLYYTDARARLSISLTTNGVSGTASYDSGTGVLNIPNYQGLVPAGGVSGQLLSKVDGSDYATQWIDEAPAASYTSQLKHVVKASQAISKGQAVYVSSGDGTNMIVSKASNVTEGTSSKTMGLLESTVSTNGFTNVITEGLLTGLNTNGASAGDPVWLGTDGNLIYGLVNKPYAPAHLVFIGIVTRANANNGEIFVKVQNGFEMRELHDYVENGVQNNFVISYESSTSLYKPKSIATLLGYTPANAANYVPYTGATSSLDVGTNDISGRYLNANGSAGLGGVLHLRQDATYLARGIGYSTIASSGTLFQFFAYTGATTYKDFALRYDGLTNNTTRIYTLPDASGTLALTSDIPSLSGYVPTNRTLTINGTSYDLSADRSWSIVAGLSSFNTRTGDITLTDTDVTGALGYTPVTNARTITINGTSYDLTADRTWLIAAGLTSFNTRTGDITLTSGDVTTALGYTPVTNARTLTINGTAYDLAADRSWTVGVNPSARTIQTYTATASQTTFTVTGGYVVGLVDVFINGVRLTSSEFTATDGSTVVLATGTGAGNIVDVIKYTSAFTASSALRQVSYFTATAGQTTFTVNYTPGLVDIFYNGSKLASSEYTASNGTSIVLSSGATLNDIVEVVAYAYSVGAFTGQAQLNGTGFVKVNGTTVSYDNTSYLPLTGGALTGGLNGTTLSLVGTNNVGIKLKQGNQIFDTPSSTSFYNGLTFENTSTTNAWSIGYSQGAKFSINYFDGSSTYSRFLSITTGGAFGIGVLSPERILDIDATGSNAAIRLRKASSNMIFLGTGSSSTAVGTENAILQMHHNGSERIRLYTEGNSWINGGNFGINTDTPNVKLEVVDASTSSGEVARFQRNIDQIYEYVHIRVGNSSYPAYFGSMLATYDVAYMSMTQDPTLGRGIYVRTVDGFTGIGTYAPTQRLHIAGASNNIFLNEATSGNYAINRLKNSTYSVDMGVDASGLYLDGSNGSFRYYNGASQRFTIGSDGAMGFNYPILGSRSFMFRALSGRALAVEIAEAGGIHSVYLRPNPSGRHLISSNYLSGGAYLPLSLSGRENDTDFILTPNGAVIIGTSAAVGKVHIAGPLVISNYQETFRRAITVHGQAGTFTQVKVIFNKRDWGSVTYDIKLASAGGSYHTAGAYYSNPGFSSHVNSINAGNGPSMSLTAASPNGGTQGATWTFSGVTMIHPSVTVDISCGNGYQIDPNDIIVEFT